MIATALKGLGPSYAITITITLTMVNNNTIMSIQSHKNRNKNKNNLQNWPWYNAMATKSVSRKYRHINQTSYKIRTKLISQRISMVFSMLNYLSWMVFIIAVVAILVTPIPIIITIIIMVEILVLIMKDCWHWRLCSVRNNYENKYRIRNFISSWFNKICKGISREPMSI